MTNCPKCKAPSEESQNECSACGILFAKWQEREENVASGNLTRYSRIATATSSEFNWTILLIVCAVLVGAIYLIGQRVNQ